MTPHALRKPRILILHDWLNVKDGGAERVLYNLLELYPQADVATLIYEPRKFESELAGRRVRTSFLQCFPKYLKARPHLLLPFVRRAVQGLPTKGYDLVIASSTAWVKNAPLHGKTRMLVYCHTPARMLWDYWPRAVTERTTNPLIRLAVTHLASNLRLWDYYESQHPRRTFLANSRIVRRRIEKYYHRQANIVYPPVEVPPIAAADKDGSYLVVSVLAAYKNIDTIIRAFFNTKRTLLIAGTGPEEAKLQALARGRTNIRFLGRVSEADKHRLMRKASGFIFANREDFGITPVEAIGCGTPVIALRGGGVSETMVEHVTAEFFDELTPAAIREAITAAEARDWSVAKLHRRAKRFDRSRFASGIRAAVEKLT